MSPLSQLVLSRIREFLREPAAIFWVYGFPLVLAFILGTAFRNRPVESIKIDVVVTDETRAEGEKLVARWKEKDPRLKVELNSEADALDRLRTAKTSLVVTPDPAASARYRTVADDNQPGSVLAKAAADVLILREANPDAKVPEATQAVDQSGGRYIDFLVPGLIGTNLMGGGLFGVGFLIVDMRVRKLLKRYLATPMRKSDFMLSIALSRLLFTLIEIALLLGVAHLPAPVGFGLTVHGNWLVLGLLVLLGGGCFAGVGLLIASRVRTLETASGFMNAFMLPQWLVSGVFFSSDTFPAWLQPLIQLLPLTALNNGLRAVVNDGAGFEALLLAPGGHWTGVFFSPLVVLGAWGGVGFFGAIKLFKWR
ncbi:MAG: ABC transporter permease [Fimbriiglobus sp.]|jgi:ABC-type multidrug transport system permease subunit|nr:ABC transporter permease [Fimbriiglobus sp.]